MPKKLPKSLEPVKADIETISRIRTRLVDALSVAKYVHANRVALEQTAWEEGTPNIHVGGDAAFNFEDIATELRALANSMEDTKYRLLQRKVEEW